MKASTWLMGIVLLAAAAGTYAHTHLVSSSPAEGSVVSSLPDGIELRFSEATRLTALTIQKDGEAEQKFGPLPNSAAEKVKVPLPRLAPGKFVINWRAVGNDGHVMTGKVRFEIG